jgi:hypothetical protein
MGGFRPERNKSRDAFRLAYGVERYASQHKVKGFQAHSFASAADDDVGAALAGAAPKLRPSVIRQRQTGQAIRGGQVIGTVGAPGPSPCRSFISTTRLGRRQGQRHRGHGGGVGLAAEDCYSCSR